MISRKRHIAKALTWRVFATGTTVTLVYIATGSIEVGLTLGSADVIIKTLAYYFHERLWYRSKWGVMSNTDK